jgi:hypothetical protein
VSYVDEARIACITATKSPFVLEGLHSPVKWRGWCREAFEAAKALDRLTWGCVVSLVPRHGRDHVLGSGGGFVYQ